SCNDQKHNSKNQQLHIHILRSLAMSPISRTQMKQANYCHFS
ncbi:hypothetical protein X975_12204, partial [Stegodyphus mimosarum]